MKRQSLRLAAMLISALWASTAMAQPAALPAVTVETAATGTFTMTTRLPGRVAASNVAEVRPQVSGIIRERMFEEGSSVAAGQPLYKIEDEIYVADVAAARAAVAQAEAGHRLASIDADRAIELHRTNVGAAATRDAAVAARDAAEAEVQAARARLASAEIDLDRTTIRAPVTGVIGLAEHYRFAGRGAAGRRARHHPDAGPGLCRRDPFGERPVALEHRRRRARGNAGRGGRDDPAEWRDVHGQKRSVCRRPSPRWSPRLGW